MISNTLQSPSKLKGKCHEMNTFLKVLKIKSLLSVDAPMVLIIFCILVVKKITFLLASMKTLTNSEDFTGSRTSLRKLSLDFIVWYRSPSHWHVSLLWRLFKEDGEPRFSLWKCCQPIICMWFSKVTHFKFFEFSTIISSLLINLQNHRRHFEVGFNKDLQN